jgi:hydroxyacylglutathione hydrolase
LRCGRIILKSTCMRIVENLYAYVWQGNDNNCNSYVFAETLKGGKHIVVDPGHLVTPSYGEAGLDALYEGMERDGVSRSSIGLVILTHGHPDHCEAAEEIRRSQNSLVALHEADEAVYGMFGGKVDFYLDEGDLELSSGNTTSLHVYHSPGHTPGHVTIYWPEKKVLIAGDCIFYRSTGRTDFPGGNALSLRKTIERLSRLDIEYLLCGHAYGNPGILKGREAIQENFRYIKAF